MADSKKIKTSELLPRFYRSDANKKFLQATLDQLIQPGTVQKVNGYVGRKNSKATTGKDIFVEAPSAFRQQYQLEPSFVIKDNLNNTTFFKDYQDYINQIGVFGGNVSNHARINNQEFYSWDPHIDWDKFVNFQNYYWMPYGPDLVKVAGQQQAIVSTYTVSIESQLDNNQYLFTPNGLTLNPTLTLYRGQTYKFEINSPGNPFSIKTARVSGTLDRYQALELEHGVKEGTITFTVPFDAPDVLYYLSENDIDLGGVIHVKAIEENTAINIDLELLGKKTYKLPTGEELSNGMKVSFIGKVTPESYALGQYYIEGVGSGIKLVPANSLEIISAYTDSEAVLFDTTPFDSMPFSDATSFAGKVDYIVVNRGSIDRNPWSRYNRWFHKDVIEASAAINKKIASIDQTARAVRPIIEFEANLKLFNFGQVAIPDVDLIDTFTTDVFSTIEGSLGYNIDGVQLVQGQRILFAADTDVFVKNNIYRVEFIDVRHLNEGSRQIHLVLENEPLTNQVVIVRQGLRNQGMTYWYNGTSWVVAQQKTALNQTPLFDVVDSNGVSYGDYTVYDGSSFVGTPVFSYKVGTGTVDPNLGFALSYKNISNVGDIVFNFNAVSDTFQYKEITNVIQKSISTGFLQKIKDLTTVEYVNGWQKSTVSQTQAALRIYKNSNKTNKFDIDIFDDISNLADLEVRIYINGIRLDKSKWTVVDGPVYKNVVLTSDILDTDILTIRAFTAQPVNSNGYYEVPINLQNNPLNNSLGDFTLGEVIDHVNSIIDNLPAFEGVFPGPSNIRDLGNITKLGTKFVQHSGPMSLALYHLTSETNNVIRSIEDARDHYNAFKRNFVAVANTLGVEADPVTQVNLVLQEINKDRPATSAYYFSDMAGYSAHTRSEFNVIDGRIKTYPLSNVYNLDELSNKAVYVYVNSTQLLYGRQYTFSDQGFVVILSTLEENDVVTIYEYENTDGCFIPETPTKLGIWPKYEPKIYLDSSLVTPRWMIQGHDGSQVLAYGSYGPGETADFRDALVLELEKRIYNNIKVKYDSKLFDIYNVIPSYVRETPYSLSEFNEVLAPNFYKWTSLVNNDFTKPLSFDRENPLTFNYRGFSAPDGRETPGYWRGIYRWMLDTDRPNICPWEMLGFSEQPQWWESVYGPAPYTSDNRVMWQDLSEGMVREPGVPAVKLEQFVRPFLIDSIPVDEYGNVISPLLANLSVGVITQSTGGDFVFGDVSPIEAAWRRSSHYPFSVLVTAMLLNPAAVFGVLFDRSRIVRNLADQIVYKDTGLRIRPADVALPSIYTSTSRVQTAGIVNYVLNYILSDNLKSYDTYQSDLKNINGQLSYRIGAFTSKEKFNLLLDSKSPLSTGSVFIPQEDYEVVLNSSSPIKKITYSAVIITKLSDGFEVKGYSKVQPYFKYYAWTQSGITINVGGISESYSLWTPGQQYAANKVVNYNNKYYRVKALHTAGGTFDPQFYQSLASLPVTGGKNATLRKGWDRTESITVPYGTKFRTIQEVVDFLVGYGEWLKDQGFIFDDFNVPLSQVTNWETSAKEFLFWTTQNWSSGQDKWQEWDADNATEFGAIVKYNGDYYRAIRKSEANPVFQEDDFVKLDGLSNVGSSVISLSPAANKLTFNAPLSIPDNIVNPFYSYEIFKVDGTPIPPNALNSYRNENVVEYSPANDDGIYGATFHLIQKEHVIVFKNTTLFNDTIYSPESGYRQERIKVSGYVTTGWYGAFDAPGFVFDQAKINDWAPWTDYALGDIVKHKEFYYTAKSFIVGSTAFSADDWVRLEEKPTERLLPNWTYKAEQFTDFYSLDSDNFDLGQQKMAQHLVGYQRRQYLSNIIKDDVSEFKFYQGMIIEKGTHNVFNKLFDVLSADGQESLDFYEEWAVRVGQYGANAAFENIEFILDEAEFKSNPQGFELVSKLDTNLVDFISRQTPNDVYLKPLGYNNNPWPINNTPKLFLRDPGYVRQDEVTTVLTTIDKIVNENIAQYSVGSYIWCGFEGQTWNVYRYSPANLTVTNVTYSSSAKELTIICDEPVTALTAGQYIGITGVSTFSGFVKVKSVSNNSFVVSKEVTGWAEPFTEAGTIEIYALVTQRALTIDDADTVVPSDLLVGELLWTDSDTNGKWGTWEYNPVYKANEINAPEADDDQNYGRALALSSSGALLAVATNVGQVMIHDRPVPSLPWTHRQTITRLDYAKSDIITGNPNSDSVTHSVVAMSPNGTWLALGSPLVGNVATVSQPSTDPLYLVNTDTGTNSALLQQGVVSIFKKDSSNNYSLVHSFISPYAQTNEQFGATLAFGENTLFVGATGRNSGTGRVYQVNYQTDVIAVTSYNPNGSAGTVIAVESVTGIKAGMAVYGVGLSGQVVELVDVVNKKLTLSSAPSVTPTGELTFKLTRWSYAKQFGNPVYFDQPSLANASFGAEIKLSKDETTLAIAAPNILAGGQVFVYNKQLDGSYTLADTITRSENEFGKSLSVSNTGKYIAISSKNYSDVDTNQGWVGVYEKVDTGYTIAQEIRNVHVEANGYFGTKVFFMNDSKTLVVYSKDSTSPSNGRVDVYDNYNTKWIYSEKLNLSAINSTSLGAGMAVASNIVAVSAPLANTAYNAAGRVYEFTKESTSTYSWAKIHAEIDHPNLDRIKSVFLYNKRTSKLINYLDVIDSSQGKIAGLAEQELKYKTFYDPATYCQPLNNVAPDSSVNIDDGMAWTKAQVGRLWWDLRTAKFINSYDEDIVYRNSTWNTLFPGASIDVYEWVESTLKPSVWDEQADTEAGIASGISGSTLYGDTAYSYEVKYDNISKTKKYTYYYWVKNKKTIPATIDRKLSAQDVADLISNPRGEGYKYLALTGTNSFTLVNIKPTLEDKDVVLSVEYWISDATQQNIHTEWKLISNNINTQLPGKIEDKWFDSLCGKDANDRLVPDMSLPPKLRYGVEFRPRQSMFINRFEALKQFVEQVNLVLKDTQITNQKDLSQFESYDPEPSNITGLYDAVLDSDLELRFASISSFRRPTVTPVITNGEITGIDIVSAGSGYLTAPYFTIVGSGTGAKVRATINARGQITGAEIISSGKGYTSGTTMLVRDYSVLVHNDTQALNAWSIYSYDPTTLMWSRLQSQAFDTRKYWEYIDWYALGYNQFSAIDYVVDTFTGLNTIVPKIGQLVKVKTNNDGNWVLLKKYSESSSIDWTQLYTVVGSQNGTFQLKDSLYSFSNTSYGYDGSLYDNSVFDNSAAKELRNILNGLKNNILIDTLRETYLELFFGSVRYSLSEQGYIDWIFKTSFVKAQHNVGDLRQDVTYNNDNLSDFESYVAEVKPYRTKVREYVSSYTELEHSPASVTDFDLQPIFENNSLGVITTTVVDGQIQADNALVTSYPWKHWLDNVGFEVTELRIIDNGRQYVTEPVIRFVGTCTEPATARAFISNGKVSRIVLLSPGKGYLKAPTVLVEGGILPEGSSARVIAVIGNSVVRSSLIKMKFDRITKTYFITELEQTETFTGTGTRVQWPLKWAPDIKVGSSSVTVAGIDVLRSDYTLNITKSTSRGYTSYAGSITFDKAPLVGQVITVSYLKDWSLLNAADRVQFYYNPESGDLGKDLAQLMTGVDYGGVIVDGIGFGVGQGWDSLPYFSDKWDNFDSTYDDFVTTVSANNHVFRLPYVPAKDTEINVYHAVLLSQEYTSNGTDVEYEFPEYNGALSVTVTKPVATATSTAIGSLVVEVVNTSNISVGDIVSSTVAGQFNFNTVVTEVINSTSVRVDQVVLATIASGTVIKFTKTLVENTDYNADLFTTIVFEQPVEANSIINITSLLRPVRINQELVHVGSTYPATPNEGIADGITEYVCISDTILVGDGDQFVLRKSTSDGSIVPANDDYDTSLQGGNLAYTTASGLRAEDIIVDGDGFVTPTSSPAPEEVVPGQVVDALAIKVYERPVNSSASIKVDTYVGDDVTVEFGISQILNSSQAVVVKVTDGTGTTVLTQVDDYTVNYVDGTVTLNSAPALGQVVSVFSFGFNGSNVLDIDYFVADGSTAEFVTRAPWLDSFTSLVYVDGLPVTPEIFETDSTYSSSHRVGLRFGGEVVAGSVINFVIVAGDEQTFSITKTEKIEPTGILTYNLSNIVGDSLPLESNMIVRVGQKILRASNNSYYTIGSNRLNYYIESTKAAPFSVDIDNIVVIADGQKLTVGLDYTVDLSGISVKLNRRTYQTYTGKTLVISIIQNQEYTYIPPGSGFGPRIEFTEVPLDTIEVISSYRHDILDVRRTEVNVTSSVSFTPDTLEYYAYKEISGGILKLTRAVIGDSYVWVVKNDTLLTPGVDYRITDDKLSVKLAYSPLDTDQFTVITFSNTVSESIIAYMQFKDMLNRVHFKRLSTSKRTKLAKALVQTDLTIEVDDASNFDVPNPQQNRPGIIEIAGERIEYFTKNGNVLGQLRRGTLGTGVRSVYAIGTYVQDIGSSETIPYSEEEVIEQVVANGSNLINLRFTPMAEVIAAGHDVVTPADWIAAGHTTDVPSNYIQADDIEVFVGGYEITTDWAPEVEYPAGIIVIHGSYTYKCLTTHTSSAKFSTDSANWQFFVGNIRLKKSPYKVHDVSVHSESPEGDIQLDAEFAVTGSTNQIRLTHPLKTGTRVTVVKRNGFVWDNNTDLTTDQTKIGEFLRAEPGVWYVDFKG